MISRAFSNKKNVLLTILAVLCVACLLGASLFAPSKTGHALTDVASFKMATGASVRTDETRAIRFTSGIAKSDLADLQEDGANDVRVITMITPTDLLDEVDEFDADCGVEMKAVEFANAYGNLTAVEGNWDEAKEQFTVVGDGSGTHYIFRAVLYNVKVENSVRNFSARSYITVNDEIYDYTDYSEADNSRNIWNVANDHLSTLEEGDDGYANLAAIAKTHQVTVTSGLDGSKTETISVKHGDKLSNYMDELESVTAPIVGNTYFACFVDGEDVEFNGYVTEDIAVTAKYTTLQYGYDSTKGVYYVADNRGYTGDTVIIPATYTGANGTADVKYVANYAFMNNTKIEKVILDKNVIVVGRSAFNGCTSLTYVSMSGVEAVAYENHFAGYNQGYENVTSSTNTFLNAPIKTLIVAEDFVVQGQQFTSDSGRITRVYSTATTPGEWGKPLSSAGNPQYDRGENCILRTGENGGFINDYNETGKSPVYYYSEVYPSVQNNNYIFWHYDANGTPVVWDKYVDTQGVNYNYDADDDCYYITYSPNVTVENLVIPEKFDDGSHGEKYVRYVAMVKDPSAGEKGAFQGNTNLKSVVLPESVKSINGKAFNGCTNLSFVEMKGVKTLQNGETNRTYNVEQFNNAGLISGTELNSMYGAFCGYNFNGTASTIKIVVADGFKALNSAKDNFDNGQTIHLYGMGMTLMSESEDFGTFNYHYMNDEPTDASYAYWHYVNGVITDWEPLDMTDEQGIAYGWDKDRKTYYVANNQSYDKAVVRIPATFDDGVHGEKKVEYVGDYAFRSNTTITHVYLPDSVKIIGDRAFQSMSSLQYLSMTGVTEISTDNPTGYAGISSTGDRNNNTFQACTALTTLVVGESISIHDGQFTSGSATATVYSLRKTPEVWNVDRTANLKTRTNSNVILKAGIIYLSNEKPTEETHDLSYTYWHYDSNGDAVVWDLSAE